jgi:rRNA maturation endonuclease Nob1
MRKPFVSLGKLSDADYQQTKQALQKELAGVLAEMEEIAKRLDLKPTRVPPPVKPEKKTAGSTLCPHCGAKFPQPLKFCGECGKAIA